MNRLRRRFDALTLPAQSAWAGAACTAVAVFATWLILKGAPQSAKALAAGAAAGTLATLGAVLLARRTGRGLRAIADEARALRRDVGADDANFALQGAGDELREASAALRRLYEFLRERLRELQAANALLGRQLHARTHELSTLEALSSGLAAKSDVEDLIEEALRALEKTIEYSSASVWGRSEREGGGQVVLLGYRSTDAGAPDADSLLGMRLSRQNLHHYEQIEREKLPIIENRVRQSLLSWLWSKVTDDARSSSLYRATRSWMGLPLKFRDDVLGVLRVDHDQPAYFEPERVRLLNAIASQTALAMRHARLMAEARDVAVLAERNRIARDLHDAVSQTLFAANVLAGTLLASISQEPAPEPAALRKSAQSLETLTRGALAEMRLLLFELRPDALEQARLPELLQRAVEALTCRGEFEVEQLIDAEDALAPAVRVQLYRIAQEAISNVARHSQASHVAVQWTVRAPGRWTLRIADDGQGFDPAQPRPGHFGVENMRARASQIDARFTVTSAAGEGTEIRVEPSEAQASQT